jgi:alanyl-tRNA synthetase
MTDELFRHDGYQSEFEAKVVSVEGDLVVLNRTAFYPGGGGQVCDIGDINGIGVTEVFRNGKDGIVHKVPGHDFREGDAVWGSVDWERRFDLMKGHTGEHILFGSLKREIPDLTIGKIFISPENKYVVVEGNVDWDTVEKAVKTANGIIRENLTVSRVIMDRDDPELKNKVRIKLENIPEDEEVTVTAIGDFDYSACSGVHVMETSELGMLFVDRVVSAGKEGTSVHFKVGDDASDAALKLAYVTLKTSDAADSKPEDLEKAVTNMKKDVLNFGKSLKGMTEALLFGLEPETVNGVKIYGTVLPGADRKAVSEAAERIMEEGNVFVSVSAGENVSAVLASGKDSVDCRKILSESLEKFNGRGGGKPDFAQGGIPNPEDAEELLNVMMEYVRSAVG